LIKWNMLSQKVFEICGENVYACYQCGKCSAGCPMADKMDILPNQIVRLVQLGEVSVLDSNAIWMCTSCFTCTLRCPRNVDVASIIDALRQVTLRRGVDAVKPRQVRRVGEYPQIALVAAFRKLTG